jgi:hypothetical protein
MIRHRITAQVVAALPFAFLMANAQVRALRASERLAATSAGSFESGRQSIRRSWDDLGREVRLFWTLRISLPDGTIVQGNSARFMTEGLTMRVEKTTRRELHPKGITFIPRKQIIVLDIRTNQPVGRAVDRRFQHVQLLP